MHTFDLFPHTFSGLRLRALRLDDLDAFHAYRRDPAVARFQGWAPMDRPACAAFLREQAGHDALVPDGWRQLAIAREDDDALIGDVGLWLSADATRVEFGLSITPDAQGQGHGTACVRGLLARLACVPSLVEIQAASDLRNLPCLALLQRAGMTPSHRREDEYKGEWCVEQVFVTRLDPLRHAAETTAPRADRT